MAKHTKSEKEIQAAASKKRREKILKDHLLVLSAHGIYNPKENKLTKYRRATIKKRFEEFKPFLNEDKYIYVNAAPKGKKVRRKIVQYAKNLEMKTSHSGVFIPKGFTKKATIKKHTYKGQPEYAIELYGVREEGRRKQKSFARITLAAPAEIDRQEGRIKREMARLGPVDEDDGERFVFVIKSNGGGADGWSKNTYSDYDTMIEDLRARYQRSKGAFIELLRHIEIHKIQDIDDYYEEHPDRSPSDVKKANRRKKALRAKARKAGLNPH